MVIYKSWQNGIGIMISSALKLVFRMPFGGDEMEVFCHSPRISSLRNAQRT